MNNLTANFNQILTFAREDGLPAEKKRGIVREYLQSLFLANFYKQPLSRKMIFSGGTALRLLRKLPRFSEDLDFDNLDLTNREVAGLVDNVVKAVKKENIAVELKSTIKDKKTYFELKFPQLLFDLRISANPKEKLMIKVDYSDFWRGQQPEVMLFNRYGFLEMVPALPLNQAIVEKLAVYVNRRQTQVRDVFDVVWLFSQGARPDKEFMRKNHLTGLAKKATVKWQNEPGKTNLRRRLEPFLFDPAEARKLELFSEVVKQL